MRSPALSRLVTVVAAILMLGESNSPRCQSNQCKCPEPPGGTVTCEKGQIPICIVKDGKVTSECKSLPPDNKTVAELNVWILSIVVGKKLTLEDVMQNPRYQKMILEARLHSGQVSISFLTFGPSMNDLPRLVNGGAAHISGGAAPTGIDLIVTRHANRLRRNGHGTTVTGNDDFETKFGSGVVSFNAEKYQEALLEFKAALTIAKEHQSSPQLSRAYDEVAATLQRMQRNNDAVTVLQEAIEALPNDPVLMGRLGATLFAQRKYSESENAFRKTMKLKPDEPRVFLLLGCALFKQRKYAEAEAAFLSGVRFFPDDGEIYFILGQTFFAEGKAPKGIDAFKRAMFLNSEIDAFEELGVRQYTLGQYAEAEDSLKKAIQRQPENAFRYGELGRILFTRLKYSEAEQAFKQAVMLDPEQPYLHVGLADSLFAQQKLEQARAAYAEALRLEPSNEIFKKRLERVLAK